jgi:P-type E1-E2 ATPase
MHEHGIDVSAANADEVAAHTAGGAATFVAIDGHLAGVLVLHDELRDDAPAAVRALRARRGIRGLVMVSGDHAEPTRLIGESLGLADRHAEALPEDKAALIRRLRAHGRVVAMVGDGVNDALALDVADVGIAVRGEPAIVAEAADVVLVRGACAASSRPWTSLATPSPRYGGASGWPPGPTSPWSAWPPWGSPPRPRASR